MKQIGLALLLVCIVSTIAFAADQSQIIADAQSAALQDGKSYTAFWWGLMSFGASLWLSPLLGGGGMILFAYCAKEAEISEERLTAAEDLYQDTDEVLFYKRNYQETLGSIEQKRNIPAAWIGTGLGTVVYVGVVFAMIYAFACP